MIAKVVTRPNGSFHGFEKIDDYIERFDAAIETWRSKNLDPIKPIPEQMNITASKGTGRVKNPAYHFVLSWNNHISNEKMKTAVERSLQVLGCEEHEWIGARHGDSQFDHVHILVNRIHPLTHKAWTPQYDYLKLRGLCRELDPQWKSREESTAPSARASDFEAWTGQQSMQSWGREHIIGAFKSTQSTKGNNWNRFHTLLGEKTGTTYEVRNDIGYIVDRSTLKVKRIKAASISPELSIQALEESFDGPWARAPYGVEPKREEGYARKIQQWSLPTKAMSNPNVSRLYARFINEQRIWKTVGKWKAKDERRIVAERLKRNSAILTADAEDALMMLRSYGGVQSETGQMVISLLARQDQEQSVAEAKRQLEKITKRRPAELFRQWLKDKTSEGDVSAGVALLSLKKRPLDGVALLELLGGPPSLTLGEIMQTDEQTVNEIIKKVSGGIRDIRVVSPDSLKTEAESLADVTVVLPGDEEKVEEEKKKIILDFKKNREYYTLAIDKIKQNGALEELKGWINAFNLAGTTPSEQEVAIPTLVAIAGAGYLDPKTILTLYADGLEGHHLPYENLGEKYKQALKKINNVIIADENLTEEERAIKYALIGSPDKSVVGVLNGQNPTWEKIYSALKPLGVTYGVYNGFINNTKEKYRGGGIYSFDGVAVEYAYLPSSLEVGINKIESKLGPIVDVKSEFAKMTKQEREQKNVNYQSMSVEEQSKFEEAQNRLNKKRKDEYIKNNTIQTSNKNQNSSEIIDKPTVSKPVISEDQSEIAADREEVAVEGQENEPELPGTIGRYGHDKEKVNQDFIVDGTNLAGLHAKTHGLYAGYVAQFGAGRFDVQRELYKMREEIIAVNFTNKLYEMQGFKGKDLIVGKTEAYAKKMQATSLLEESWSREVDVLHEAIGDRPLTYAQWLREREETDAKKLADLVEEQDRSSPRIYRPITADKDMLLMKNLAFTKGKDFVQFTYSGKNVFHDDGNTLHIKSSRDKDSLKVALLIAYDKYGKPEDPDVPHGVYLTGSAGYQRRTVEAAAEMGIPIANEELQELYKIERQKFLVKQRSEATQKISKTPVVGTLRKEIENINRDESINPEKTDIPEEKKSRQVTRDNTIDDAIAREMARKFSKTTKIPVRILEPDQIVEGQLNNITMFPNGRAYAIVETAKPSETGNKTYDDKIKYEKHVPEIVFARITQEVAAKLMVEIGKEVVVERPLTGPNHVIEMVKESNRGQRTR